MSLRPLLPSARPLLILAPMQDVTDLPFMRVMHHYGGPDLYYTEYFRVYEGSHPEKYILEAIRENPTGKPVIAQMIGEHIPSLVLTAEKLQKENIVGVDLNCGCPAPIVCRKTAGGGLLRRVEHVADILKALRPAVKCALTVKTRIGFEDPSEFGDLLDVYTKSPIEALTVHGRTVREMYRSEVHFDAIARAVEAMSCPVFANGNVLSAPMGREIHRLTGAAGLMIGRGAIRNPWIFNQIRELYETGEVRTVPTLRDVRVYVEMLYRETSPAQLDELKRVAKMKKYMNFIGQGIGGGDEFLNAARRSMTEREFFENCDRYLDSDEPFAVEPPGKALVHASRGPGVKDDVIAAM